MGPSAPLSLSPRHPTPQPQPFSVLRLETGLWAANSPFHGWMPIQVLVCSEGGTVGESEKRGGLHIFLYALPSHSLRLNASFLQISNSPSSCFRESRGAWSSCTQYLTCDRAPPYSPLLISCSTSSWDWVGSLPQPVRLTPR